VLQRVLLLLLLLLMLLLLPLPVLLLSLEHRSTGWMDLSLSIYDEVTKRKGSVGNCQSMSRFSIYEKLPRNIKL
jgi:hypothetical protein